MRSSLALRKRARVRRDARAAEAVRRVVCAELKDHEGSGSMMGDTTGFHERANGWDFETRPPVGFQAVVAR